jgi:hypothetical protein
MSEFRSTHILARFDGTTNAAGNTFDPKTITDFPESVMIYSNNSFIYKDHDGVPDTSVPVGVISDLNIDDHGIVTGSMCNGVYQRLGELFPNSDVFLCSGAMVSINKETKVAENGVLVGFFPSDHHIDKRIKPVINRGDAVQPISYREISDYDTVCKSLPEGRLFCVDFIGEATDDVTAYIDDRIAELKYAEWNHVAVPPHRDLVPEGLESICNLYKQVGDAWYNLEICMSENKTYALIWRV